MALSGDVPPELLGIMEITAIGCIPSFECGERNSTRYSDLMQKQLFQNEII